MSDSHDYPEDFAARALELLEQAYGYYNLPPRSPANETLRPQSETYYQYVKAA